MSHRRADPGRAAPWEALKSRYVEAAGVFRRAAQKGHSLADLILTPASGGRLTEEPLWPSC